MIEHQMEGLTAWCRPRGFGITRRPMRAASGRLLLFAAVIAALGGCSDGQVQRNDTGIEQGYIDGDGTVSIYPPAERGSVSSFSGPLVGNGHFDLESASGDVVVVNVWASWCPPCRREAPDLQATYEALAGQGVQFIGVNTTRDSERDAQAFEREFGITYPSVYDPKGEALLALRDLLPPAAIPSTLIIDREGRTAARVLGPIGEASLSQMVSQVAAEQVDR